MALPMATITVRISLSMGARMLFCAVGLLLRASRRLLRAAAGLRRRRRLATWRTACETGLPVGVVEGAAHYFENWEPRPPEEECRVVPSFAEVAKHEMRFSGARCALTLDHEGKHRTRRGHEFDGFDPPVRG